MAESAEISQKVLWRMKNPNNVLVSSRHQTKPTTNQKKIFNQGRHSPGTRLDSLQHINVSMIVNCTVTKPVMCCVC